MLTLTMTMMPSPTTKLEHFDPLLILVANLCYYCPAALLLARLLLALPDAAVAYEEVIVAIYVRLPNEDVLPTNAEEVVAILMILRGSSGQEPQIAWNCHRLT